MEEETSVLEFDILNINITLSNGGEWTEIGKEISASMKAD